MRFKDAVDIKSYTLIEVMETVIDAHGIEDVLSILQDKAIECGYEMASDWIKTAIEAINAEDAYSLG